MSGLGIVAPTELLLERESELSRLTHLLSALGSGSGGMVIVEGAAGLGKTALLQAILEQAEDLEIEIFRARGTELERSFAFGLARQLFESKLAAQDPPAREQALGEAAALALPAVTDATAGEITSSFSVLHGLYWLLLGLTNRTPTLLVLDDLHWADQPTLDWLDYLLNRITDLPVLIVAGARPSLTSETTASERRSHALWSHDAVERLRLEPLGQASVARLLQQRFGLEPYETTDGFVVAIDSPAARDRSVTGNGPAVTGNEPAAGNQHPEPVFVAACHKASGGNPFLLRELLDTVSLRGLPMTAAAAGEVTALASDDLVRRTRARLARLGADATAAGRALATLEHGAETLQLAAVAELDHDRASAALDLLIGADLASDTQPAQMVHPLIRTAILDGLPPGLRSELHARAAAVLSADGGDPERIAAHLLECYPTADVDRVRLLGRAAAVALGRGSPASAVTFLRRALREPPSPAQRVATLRELGEAELLGRYPEAIGHLRAALEIAEDRLERAEIGYRLGEALVYVGEWDEGVATLRDARSLLLDADTNSHELRARVDAQILTLTGFSGRGPDGATAEIDEDMLARARDPAPADRPLTMTVALACAVRGECEEVGAMVSRTLADGRFLLAETSDSMAVVHGAYALIFVDRLAEALVFTRSITADGQRRGSVLGVIAGSTHCAFAELRMGALADAEADALAAFELARQHGLLYTLPFIAAYLSLAMLDRGESERALATVESIGLDPRVLNTPSHHTFLEARARVRLEWGQRERAIEDLHECREVTRALRAINPNVCGWRTLLAQALAGEQSPEARAEANALASESLSLARRCRSARSEGIALRVLASVADPPQRTELLRDSVSVLAVSPARLELARSQLELGSELVRQGLGKAARGMLLESMQIANQCGARPLAEQALDRARAAGARPRRPAVSGRDALTAAELRVARMAAAGNPNREIAQALFITTRTVKAHLTSIYRKLDIDTRKHLTRALSDPGTSST